MHSCPDLLLVYIQHSRSSPYHPTSNGEAERFVRTFKESITMASPLSHQLANFLLTYRTTAHSTTGAPPRELLMGRTLCTRWDLLKPDVRRRVELRQAKQKERHDRFQTRQARLLWLRILDLETAGFVEWEHVTYLVNFTGGRLWKRHLDNMKELRTPPDPPDDTDCDASLPPLQDETVTPLTSDDRSDKTSDSPSTDPIDPQGVIVHHPNHPNRLVCSAMREPRFLHRLIIVIRYPRYPTRRCLPTRYDPSF